MARVIFIYRSQKANSFLTSRLILGKFSKDEKENSEKIFDCKTQVEVSKDYWNNYLRQTKEKNGKLYKANHKTIRDIKLSNFDLQVKTELNNIKNFVLEAVGKIKEESINKEWFINIIDGYYNQDKSNTEITNELVKFVDYYIDEKQDEITQSTVKKLKVVKHKLERFQKEKKKILLISEINETFKNEFIDYSKKENYAIGTIQRDLVFIKTFCNYAHEKGLEVDRNINKVKIKVKKESKPIYLTVKELEKIEKVELNESFDNVRDWLIISCYTGQRVSDFMKFRTDMIREEDSRYLLEFKQQKTNKLMTIPILPKVEEVLNKRNWNFPKALSDQKYNDYLKLVCKEAGITEKIKGSKKKEIEPESGKYRKEEGVYEKWELVSSHIGRRSFATNFYGIIPTNYIINMTGHSTETIFLDYIGKSNKDLAKEVFKYL
ncbi:hypothetical protein EG359_12105 [Chryseobacterium joostei]|uniref:Site-specific recombinase XerD n=1 Tax=Chryseobacterium joostei TaxID=112234 RepID=A0A1N7IHD9_9FLAO|nr:phage integrase SAM-like domain-containing protein [Chryseobacterium joostei]AZB00316.1 hypothetical protein EG359_12105 [Chryseobacterium joostei]SIS36524.1 Site-specific recombinase XerD [Chryseobacterium joostei]